MVIKQDYDAMRKESFLHIEIETLPYVTGEEKYTHLYHYFSSWNVLSER